MLKVVSLIHVNNNFKLPYLVVVLQKVAQVACGWRHTLAFTEKKNVFAWGRGTSGQLGHGEIVDRWFLFNVFIQALI